MRDAKHLCRTYERKWGRSDCDAEKHRYCSIKVVAKEIYNAKAKYYSSKIEEYSGNPKMLYKLTDALTVNKQGQQLPSNRDDSQLSNNFCEFLEEKITCTAEEHGIVEFMGTAIDFVDRGELFVLFKLCIF